jgi:hypothetical protein
VSMHTPFAEMLAVVSEEPVAVFAYPGAGAADYLMPVKARRHTRAYPDRPASGEMWQRNLLHRAAAKSMCQSPVVNDPARPHVNPVMSVTMPRCDEVCPQGRLAVLIR